jgi:phage antirepressor YoqD-like protein
MNNLVVLNEQTMTSREIADLTLSTHDSVLKSIRRYIEQGVVSPTETQYEHPQNGQTYPEYRLGFRDSMFIASGYSSNLRARIIDRWMELEAGQAKVPTPALPQTFAQALRLAAEQAEVIESQAAALEAAQPAIQMVERYVEAKSSKCLSDVAKILGWKPREFIAQLAAHGVIFWRAGSWLPYQNYIDSGKFTVKTGESNGHAYHQTRVEPAGIEWLARTYGKGKQE